MMRMQNWLKSTVLCLGLVWDDFWRTQMYLRM
jgi:hypothetical protein